MRLILCGGGSEEKTKLVNDYFKKNLNRNKPLLYIPIAMKKEKYPSCLEWITRELKALNLKEITMVNNSNEILEKDLNEYAAIFIGGGNTFKLLSELKETDSFYKLEEFIKNNGMVFGGSAGAIIFGKDILSCSYADENNVELKDTKGFNCLNGYSLVAHYTNEDEIKTKATTNYLIEYSKKHEPVIALPEEDSFIVEYGKFFVIGTKPYYIFKNGILYKYEVDEIPELD